MSPHGWLAKTDPVRTSTIKQKIYTYLLIAFWALFGSSTYAWAGIGGADAPAGKYPCVVSIQKLSDGVWSHAVTGVIIGPNSVLTVANAVDGESPANIRVVAGIGYRSEEAQGVIRNISHYTMHESYQMGTAAFSNDIALLNLTTSIAVIPGQIEYAILPADNSDDLLGASVSLVGWGQTACLDPFPDCLQEANINVISTQEANTKLSTVPGALVWENHLALYDTSNIVATSNGDGVALIPAANGGWMVVGVTSWAISVNGCVDPTYPSTMTRVSSYLGWIDGYIDPNPIVINSVVVDPISVSLTAGQQITFTALVNVSGNGSSAVTWSCSGGSITSGGLYTAPLVAGTYTVTATSVPDVTKEGSATVTVGPRLTGLKPPCAN